VLTSALCSDAFVFLRLLYAVGKGLLDRDRGSSWSGAVSPMFSGCWVYGCRVRYCGATSVVINFSRSSACPIIQIHWNSYRNLFELKIRFTLSGLSSSFETADLMLLIFAMNESIRTPASYATAVGIHVMGRSTALSSSFALPPSVNEDMFHRKHGIV